MPAVGNPARKARAVPDFRFFCDSYLPLTFHLAWTRDHLKVIGRIEQAVEALAHVGRKCANEDAAGEGQAQHEGVLSRVKSCRRQAASKPVATRTTRPSGKTSSSGGVDGFRGPT